MVWDVIATEYLAPTRPGEVYSLPPVRRMLEHLRMCGGDIHIFMRRCIKEREHRQEVLNRFLQMVTEDDLLDDEFRKIRKAYERALKLQAEEVMYRHGLAGGKGGYQAAKNVIDHVSIAEERDNRPKSSLDLILEASDDQA